MSMAKEGSSFCHPLFDPWSRYGSSSRHSVWSNDQGQRCTQKYFFGLYQEYLKENGWRDGVPSEAQDWGYTPEVNQMVHEFLKAEREDALAAKRAQRKRQP